MRDLWINKKDIGYAKLHYEAVLRLKLRLNVAFTTQVIDSYANRYS